MTGLLEGWRQEMREQKNNIRISALSPGNTETRGASRYLSAWLIHTSINVSDPSPNSPNRIKSFEYVYMSQSELQFRLCSYFWSRLYLGIYKICFDFLNFFERAEATMNLTKATSRQSYDNAGLVETEFQTNMYPDDPERARAITSSIPCLQVR